MTKTKEEKKRIEAENKASVESLLEGLDNRPNIDIDPSSIIAERGRKNIIETPVDEEPAVDVPTRPESKKHHGTLDLPIELYECLRLVAYQKRKSKNSIVSESVKRFLDECDGVSAW